AESGAVADHGGSEQCEVGPAAAIDRQIGDRSLIQSVGKIRGGGIDLRCFGRNLYRFGRASHRQMWRDVRQRAHLNNDLLSFVGSQTASADGHSIGTGLQSGKTVITGRVRVHGLLGIGAVVVDDNFRTADHRASLIKYCTANRAVSRRLRKRKCSSQKTYNTKSNNLSHLSLPQTFGQSTAQVSLWSVKFQLKSRA